MFVSNKKNLDFDKNYWMQKRNQRMKWFLRKVPKLYQFRKSIFQKIRHLILAANRDTPFHHAASFLSLLIPQVKSQIQNIRNFVTNHHDRGIKSNFFLRRICIIQHFLNRIRMNILHQIWKKNQVFIFLTRHRTVRVNCLENFLVNTIYLYKILRWKTGSF